MYFIIDSLTGHKRPYSHDLSETVQRATAQATDEGRAIIIETATGKQHPVEPDATIAETEAAVARLEASERGD